MLERSIGRILALVFETKTHYFLFQKKMGKHAQSIDSQILRRIHGKGKGWVFTPSDFQDLGSRTAVGLALMRHRRTGVIRQLARGLYDYPHHDPRFGLLTPSAEDIARALKGRDDFRLQPHGAYAANLLGLSDQVPVKVVFLTDGPSRKVQFSKRQIILKHTTTRNMATAGKITGTVIQALRWLGQLRVDDQSISILRRKLTDADKQQLVKDMRYAPAWIADIIRKLAHPE